MTRIEEIEKAITGLPPEALAEFRAWFEAFDAEQWDRTLSADSAAGKLDSLAGQALADYKNGLCKEL